MKSRNPIFVILLFLPVFVYSQDTSNIEKALKGRAGAESPGKSEQKYMFAIQYMIIK